MVKIYSFNKVNQDIVVRSLVHYRAREKRALTNALKRGDGDEIAKKRLSVANVEKLISEL